MIGDWRSRIEKCVFTGLSACVMKRAMGENDESNWCFYFVLWNYFDSV